MQTIQRNCQECGTAFAAQTGGRPRVYCTTQCRKARRKRDAAVPAEGQCAIEGCEKPRYQRRVLCSTHVMRKHRYGDPMIDKSRAGRAWDHSHGYKIAGAKGHPLADAKGSAYAHRLVLFEKIGSGPQECHWCGCDLTWGDGLEVDHVNNQRDDNRPENLVPTCHGCNTRRAMALRYGKPWSPPRLRSEKQTLR